MSTNLYGGTTYYLQSSISSTGTTILLSSFLEPVSGVPITMELMNSTVAYATIAPFGERSEFISFTTITQNDDGTATLTGVTRGLRRGYPYTSDSSFMLAHNGNSKFILSDQPAALYAATDLSQALQFYVNKTSTQTVTNSVALVNDTELQWAVISGVTYYFKFELLVTNANNAGPDWKSAIKTPAGSTGSVVLSGAEPAGSAFPQAVTTDVTTPGTLVNTTIVADADVPFNVTLQGWVTAGANGTLALQFAENTAAPATSISVLKGSRVTYSI